LLQGARRFTDTLLPSTASNQQREKAKEKAQLKCLSGEPKNV